MGQPTSADEEFGTEDVEVEETNDGDVELDEVDSNDEETDEVEEGDEAEKPKKTAKKKAKARPPVPEGYIAPVAFAKVLTAREIAAGRLEEDEEVPPQMIYSYIKNTAKGKDPLPSYSAGGRDNLLKEAEALAWWDRKEERAKERKAAKKAEKAKPAAETKEAEDAE